MASQGDRVERLERKVLASVQAEDLEDAPRIVLCWPEDETPEVREANRKAREWYEERGIDWSDLPLVLTWEDGTEVTPP